MAMSYKTSEAIKYQKAFATYSKNEAQKQNWIMSNNRFQHYYVDAVFYFPRIDQDCNNYWKCLFDAITDSKSVWLDDTQACERVKGIRYDNKNPRIELEIYPVDYIGIFDNNTQLELFESNCIHCNRYRNGNCSLLNKAKEGRLQEEISDWRKNNE
jgi:Holliday junction resolvase RusA-like endonuclease